MSAVDGARASAKQTPSPSTALRPAAHPQPASAAQVHSRSALEARRALSAPVLQTSLAPSLAIISERHLGPRRSPTQRRNVGLHRNPHSLPPLRTRLLPSLHCAAPPACRCPLARPPAPVGPPPCLRRRPPPPSWHALPLPARQYLPQSTPRTPRSDAETV
ncbi:hypothetical protein IQ07DRAFT_424597 [Pyrenochaeta sp. DS3sAY3a]|nr:hypothetical protein IQ07DRAFT_424597 [Pyrenochaeta sp. DS3sAY3a]